MRNLLEETLTFMKEQGKSIDDIVWIGSESMEIPIDRFMQLANEWYSNDSEVQDVACDLVIVFNDNSWFERREYNNSELWICRKVPKRPSFLMENTVAVMRSQMPYEYKTYFGYLHEMNGLEDCLI